MKTFLLYPVSHTIPGLNAIAIRANHLSGDALDQAKIHMESFKLATLFGPDKSPGYQLTTKSGVEWLLMPVPEN